MSYQGSVNDLTIPVIITIGDQSTSGVLTLEIEVAAADWDSRNLTGLVTLRPKDKLMKYLMADQPHDIPTFLRLLADVLEDQK